MNGFMCQRWEASVCSISQKPTNGRIDIRSDSPLTFLLEIHSPPSYTLLVKVKTSWSEKAIR